MNAGFFDSADIPNSPIKVKKSIIYKNINCQSCGLSNFCKSPKMGMQGKGKKKILIIIEYPTVVDDAKGKYLSGDIGNAFIPMFKRCNINIWNDCWVIAAQQCCGEKKRIKSCNNEPLQLIKKLNPKIVLTFGIDAINSILSNKLTGRLSGITLLDFVGYKIPDQALQCFICPSWNIGCLYESKNYKVDPIKVKQMESHIQHALALYNKPFYSATYESDAFPITNVKKAIKILQDMQTKNAVAVDYETTGLKPHRKGQEIVYASVSDGLFSYAFPFFHSPLFRKEWKALLQSSTGKICHNAKFEYTWTKVLEGYKIKHIVADTMLDAHVLHNKKKTNLKFLTYVHFGIIYENDIGQYLEASKEEKDMYGGNAFNRIKEAPREQVLLYNALDSLFTYKLWELQQGQLTKHTKQGSAFFRDASIELAKAEQVGMLLDEPQAKKEHKRLTNKMARIEYTIAQSDDMKTWDKETPFRPSAPGDLSHLLFDCMKLKPRKDALTPTGKPSADVEAMEKYDLLIVQQTLQWRKYKKIRDTYLQGFITESVNSLIHTSLNLGRVDTYRSSSDSPNLQNIPARDLETMQLLRKLIIARPGHKLGEYDYRALEAVIICIYNKDPKWIEYVSDIKNDMHRDMAAKLVLRNKKDVMKDERQIVKSGFVFPTVYGSYWKNTAKNLWDEYNSETKVHLQEKGIETLDDYREHVKKIEHWFWHEQFPTGFEWMQKTLRDYEKKGYIDLLTGFRCYGPMTRNQVLNTPIQGTASHCKLWTFNKVSKLITKEKKNSRLLLEIHDSIIPDIDPEEEEWLDQQMWLYGTQKIREEWEWLLTPLFIEKKISAIDGNWSEMENKGLLKGIL